MSFGFLAELVTFRPFERPLHYYGTRRSPFSAAWSTTVDDLAMELDMLRATGVVLELDMQPRDFRGDGIPRAAAVAATPGIVLSFISPKIPTPVRYEVTAFDRWQDNVRAAALALRALRAVDRYGVTRSGEQYRGWQQLGAGHGAGDGDPVRGAELVERHGGIKPALHAAHPDHGGEPDDFKDVIAYRDSLR